MVVGNVATRGKGRGRLRLEGDCRRGATEVVDGLKSVIDARFML